MFAKRKPVRKIDDVHGIMREFNEMAALLDCASEMGFEFKEIKRGTEDYRLYAGRVSAASRAVYFTADEQALNTNIHELLHVKQLANSPLLDRSARFYGGDPSFYADADESSVVEILSPAAFAEAAVAMEVAVIVNEIRLMHMIEHSDAYKGSLRIKHYYPTFSKAYSELMETGIATVGLTPDGLPMRFALPANIVEDKDLLLEVGLSFLATVIFTGAGTKKSEKLLRNVYAQGMLEDMANYELHDEEAISEGYVLDFVPLRDDVLRAVGDIGPVNIFRDPDKWHSMVARTDLMTRYETANALKAIENKVM